MTYSFYLAVAIGILVSAIGIALVIFGIKIFFKKEVPIAFWRNQKLIQPEGLIAPTLTGWKKNTYGIGLVILGFLLQLLV